MKATPEKDRKLALEAICAELAVGKSLRAICRQYSFPESTIRGWLLDDEEAFAQSARARELGCDALADECIDIADGEAGVTDPTDKRIRIDTRLRLIGKWSSRYADKQKLEHSGKDGGAIEFKDLSRLSDAELHRLASES
jgi:hypothetical protein